MNKEELKGQFVAQFGQEPQTFYFAPGRINLIGEHTDYNGGHVFPCAITLGTYGAVAKRSDDKICCYSMNRPEEKIICGRIGELKHAAENGWADYPFGVVSVLEKAGYHLPHGFNLAIWGDLPNGAGLSSSASLEVLTAFACRDIFNWDISLIEIAKLCQKAENEFVGMNCGIMDQFAVALGKKDQAMFLDCGNLQCRYLPIALKDCSIVIANTNCEHKLVGSEYNLRRAQCEQALADLKAAGVKIEALGDLSEEEFLAWQEAIKAPLCRQRAHHAVFENQRTIKAVTALERGDLEGFGALMRQSHESLRDDYEVTGKYLDALASLAWEQSGTIGSRMTGGGFGGCTVSIVKDEHLKDFQAAVGAGYKAMTGLEASFYVASVSEGVHKL